jgi:uncharacterized membrane protein YgcG
MTRSFTWMATVLAMVLIVLAADTTSQAQDRGRGRRGGGDGIAQGRRGPGSNRFGGGRRGGGGADFGSLLRSEQVQTELKLDEGQLAKIVAISEKSREQSRELFSGMRDLSDDERRAKGEELQKKMRQLQTDMRQQLETVLNATQVKRLDELTLQIRGIGAFADSEFCGKLSITDEQKQGIDDIIAAQRDMQRELFGSMRELRDLDDDERTTRLTKMREKGEEITRETEAAVLELLSEEQRTSYKQMKGEPFELDRRSMFGGGRGGPDGQRGRGRAGGGRGGDGGRGANRPQRPEAI